MVGGLSVGLKTFTPPFPSPEHSTGSCHHIPPFKAHTSLISQTEAQYVFGFDKAQTRAGAVARDRRAEEGDGEWRWTESMATVLQPLRCEE